MKKLTIIFIYILLNSCSQNQQTQPAFIPKSNTSSVQYKPGLGELMSIIQTHHAKLWFAGINSNWKLADYEIGEIKEIFQTAVEFEPDRKEINNIPMIYGNLDSVSNAIKKGNVEFFKRSFQSLTSTCNNCHRTSKFEFNVITIPTNPPVTNQDFRKEK